MTALRMHLVVENDVGELSNHASLIWHTVDIEDRDQPTKCASGDFVCAHPVNVNEGTGHSTVVKSPYLVIRYWLKVLTT